MFDCKNELDTSVLISSLKKERDTKIASIKVNMNQSEDMLHPTEEKTVGVLKHFSNDKIEFVSTHLFPVIKIGTLYPGKYSIHTSLSRSLIAKSIDDISKSKDILVPCIHAWVRGNSDKSVKTQEFSVVQNGSSTG
ncbi:MAG: argininosuccinate synthase [Nitrososphaerota archaeon]|jgi:argininosuccinate synthase|nr:argininosuccinate synthase [Nitrososphaerota archaeon]